MNKRTFKWFLALVAVFALMVFSVRIENQILSSISKDKVYKYLTGDECWAAVEGSESVFVEDKDGIIGAIVRIDHFKRTVMFEYDGNGITHISTKQIGDVIYNVYRHLDLEDRYVSIYAFNNAKLDLSENTRLEFITSVDGELTRYYAYLPDYTDGYSLIVNGEEIPL